MFELQTQILLNRFRCAAMVAELSEGQEKEDTGAKDRAGSDKKEKDRRAYVERGLKRIQEFERRANGEKG